MPKGSLTSTTWTAHRLFNPASRRIVSIVVSTAWALQWYTNCLLLLLLLLVGNAVEQAH